MHKWPNRIRNNLFLSWWKCFIHWNNATYTKNPFLQRNMDNKSLVYPFHVMFDLRKIVSFSLTSYIVVCSIVWDFFLFFNLCIQTRLCYYNTCFSQLSSWVSCTRYSWGFMVCDVNDVFTFCKKLCSS